MRLDKLIVNPYELAARIYDNATPKPEQPYDDVAASQWSSWSEPSPELRRAITIRMLAEFICRSRLEPDDGADNEEAGFKVASKISEAINKHGGRSEAIRGLLDYVRPAKCATVFSINMIPLIIAIIGPDQDDARSQAILGELPGKLKWDWTLRPEDEMPGTQHPVTPYLLNPELPSKLREMLYESAVYDVQRLLGYCCDEAPDYLYAWKQRVLATQNCLACSDSSLRFKARKDLGQPTSDEGYALYIVSQKAQQETKEKQIGELVFQAMGNK